MIRRDSTYYFARLRPPFSIAKENLSRSRSNPYPTLPHTSVHILKATIPILIKLMLFKTIKKNGGNPNNSVE